uniref:Uncharacterized protein n=1 Tax=Acrobeloides nanus TaxID=290746 RepID=A0A914C086_9BILA
MRNGGYVTLKEREDMVSSNPTLKKSWKSRLCGIQTSFAILFILILVLSITVEHHRISTLWAALDNLGRMSIEKTDRLTTNFKLNSSFKLNTSFNVDDNLDNMVIERRNILVDFQYGNGGYLDVWKDPKYTRYYVTPICEIVAESTKCLNNEYDLQHPYIVVLPIQLWNGKAAEMAALAITHKIRENSSSSGADVQPNDCRPLPIKSARLVTNTLLNFDVPSGFRPNVLAEGNAAKFYLYPKDKIMCQKIVTDVQQNPTLFLEKIDLYLEYTMTVGKQSKREVIVTSESLTKSEAFSILNNTYENKNGTVYLTSSDMNKFSRDVLKTINIIDTSTADFISTEEENNLIKSLIQDLKDETTLASKLPKGEWDSVFWSDLFTRPDIVTSYLEKTFSYDQGKQQFIYDSKNETEFYGDLKDKLSKYSDKSWAGSASASYGPFSAGGEVSHKDIDDMKKDWENLTKMAQKGELHSNNMTEYLKQNNRTVQWTGEKYVPKGLDLHRVNTNKLLIRGQIFYQKIVMTEIPATVRNRIQTEFGGNSTPSTDFYEELIQLRNKTIDLQSKLDTLKNQTFTTTDGLHTSIDALARLLKETEANWQKNLQNTTNNLQNAIASSSMNINNVKNELNNKISEAKKEASQSINNLESRLRNDLLSKVIYEQSVGLLGHEHKAAYDRLERHRLCRLLAAASNMAGSFDEPLWNMWKCEEFYSYSRSEPFRVKGDW